MELQHNKINFETFRVYLRMHSYEYGAIYIDK